MSAAVLWSRGALGKGILFRYPPSWVPTISNSLKVVNLRQDSLTNTKQSTGGGGGTASSSTEASGPDVASCVLEFPREQAALAPGLRRDLLPLRGSERWIKLMGRPSAR